MIGICCSLTLMVHKSMYLRVISNEATTKIHTVVLIPAAIQKGQQRSKKHSLFCFIKELYSLSHDNEKGRSTLVSSCDDDDDDDGADNVSPRRASAEDDTGLCRHRLLLLFLLSIIIVHNDDDATTSILVAVARKPQSQR